jgi:hypothetical protein
VVHLFRLADGSPAGPPSGERDQAGLDELQVAEVVKDLLAAAPAPGAEGLGEQPLAPGCDLSQLRMLAARVAEVGDGQVAARGQRAAQPGGDIGRPDSVSSRTGGLARISSGCRMSPAMAVTAGSPASRARLCATTAGSLST